MGSSNIMKNDMLGEINKDSLDTLILELNNDVDSISSLLHEVDMLVYDTNDYFKGKVADSFREKYSEYKSQSETFIKNLSSYADDLLAIKISMIDNDVKMGSAFDAFSEEIKVSK